MKELKEQPNPTSPNDSPEQGLSFVGLIMSALLPPIGLVISIIAYKRSKRAGKPNVIAITGILIGLLLLCIGLVEIAVAVLDKGLEQGLRQLISG